MIVFALISIGMVAGFYAGVKHFNAQYSPPQHEKVANEVKILRCDTDGYAIARLNIPPTDNKLCIPGIIINSTECLNGSFEFEFVNKKTIRFGVSTDHTILKSSDGEMFLVPITSSSSFLTSVDIKDVTKIKYCLPEHNLTVDVDLSVLTGNVRGWCDALSPENQIPMFDD